MGIINWGIIGLGGMANNFAESITDVNIARVKGIAGKNIVKTNKFQQKFSVDKKFCFTDYEDLLKCEEIDIIYIAVTNNIHFKWIKKAIEYNKHILVEKPATINAEESSQVCDLLKFKNLLFCEGLMFMHHPRTKLLLNTIREGKIGSVTKISSSFGCEVVPKLNFFKRQIDKFKRQNRLFSNQLGGGCILDLGCYLISITQIISNTTTTEKPIYNLKKRLLKFSYKNVEVDATVEIEVDCKSTFNLHCSFTQNLGEQTIIEGTEGVISLPSSWSCNKDTFLLNEKYTLSESSPFVNPFSNQIKNISKCLLEHNYELKNEVYSFYDFHTNMELIDSWKIY
jgi:predicted dehydrogenase